VLFLLQTFHFLVTAISYFFSQCYVSELMSKYERWIENRLDLNVAW
jgi:hypothetical protein